MRKKISETIEYEVLCDDGPSRADVVEQFIESYQEALDVAKEHCRESGKPLTSITIARTTYVQYRLS